MRQRATYSVFAATLLLCGLVVVALLRWNAPPETAKLLPEADAILYINLVPVRAAIHFDRQPVTPSPTYQHFIDATGIILERDLDSAAASMHRLPDTQGPNGPVGYSEVFKGRFDAGRVARYLAGVATGQQTYAGRVVYSIPSEGRTLRVAILGPDLVAASNMPTEEQIHAILDRRRVAASPFAGSSLLNAFYREVPSLSTAWAVGQIASPFARNGGVAVGDLDLPVAPDGIFVGSVGVSGLHPGSVAVRIDQIAPDQASAARFVGALAGMLALIRALQPPGRTPSEQAARQIVDSVRVEQHGDRASVTAILPQQTLRTLAAAR